MNPLFTVLPPVVFSCPARLNGIPIVCTPQDIKAADFDSDTRTDLVASQPELLETWRPFADNIDIFFGLNPTPKRALVESRGEIFTIPAEIEECAKVDDATQAQAFLYILLPMAVPILMVVFVLAFIGVKLVLHAMQTVLTLALLPVGADAYGNPTYDPTYAVTYSRVYKTTPAWGTNSDGQHTTFTACTECHEFPLTTSFPSVQAGEGDSHQWIDDKGYGNLHAYNEMLRSAFGPISCRTCHYGTVTAANGWTRNSMDVTTYNAVPLASRRFHVNGSKDVVFDKTNPVIYSSTMSLNTATYDSGTRTCTNVACHLQQTRVTWGSPYRWSNQTECNLCHGN